MEALGQAVSQGGFLGEGASQLQPGGKGGIKWRGERVCEERPA